MPKMLEPERKAKYNELKVTLNETWKIEANNSDDKSMGVSVPSNFKQYTIQEGKFLLQCMQKDLGQLYDGPKLSKTLDLAQEGDTSKLA